MRPSRILVATTIAATALVTVAPAEAGLSAEPNAEVLADGLDGPLQVDATDHGIYFSQSNLSGLKRTKLSKVRKDGTVVDLVTLRGGKVEIAGVDTRGKSVAFTVTRYQESDPAAKLRMRHPKGGVRTLADLRSYEERKNPDARSRYGLRNLPPDCEVPPFLERSGGIVDSHPYAVANGPNGSWFVADAAANAILKVARSGAISTVAVLPPQPAVITAEAAEANELPPCVVGLTLDFEPVPTDVQLRQGKLFVTLLPGGPEDPSLGARGSLVTVDVGSGDVQEVAGGFLAATNVALAGPNKAYVAELFGGTITQVNLTTGDTSTYAQRGLPSAVDVLDGAVYVTEGIFGPPKTATGQLVKLGGVN